MESLCIDLPRKLDLIVNLLIYLGVKIHETKHFYINTKISTQDLEMIICMSLPILFLSSHKIVH
jgi:hypothetical protein